MNEVEIDAWVAQAPQGQQGFREAVHTILDGIGHSQNLSAKMVMKGGLLLAIRYDSSRYTRDLDFSTRERYTAESADAILEELMEGLVSAEDRLPYVTACRLQSHKVQPKGDNKTHHSLALKIGFANRSNAAAMARLEAGTAPQVVEIDYSFNEAVFEVEVLELDGGATIHSYTLNNVLAEKMRSLLQQPIRRRNRRQDVYDIWLLLESGPSLAAEELARILEILMASCASKGIVPNIDSMEADAVVSMARTGYQDLASDVAGDLPPFEDAMNRVVALYRTLPW
ncbi:nucleotidyl transferase AbiEii/AbiGii toxin family protein [Acidovorax sp. GBBC 3334]|uniref:nucleotidyl transferase AbiEii/AbiGii toxin family protein n=1 Tax=Acidovorax sp. GBBC 3334 TaxID=2940496 RepID=UPI00230264DE|nr:nucleotidyl transferase AbiEii/AbiGii toxin family protein [Acidovorax sp. GBBC 3334]MDA8454355.1 nucleotidyl transferase AbiEii/AbiGii toxin family protein [Acidovorax sp. GBBC 3334]